MGQAECQCSDTSRHPLIPRLSLYNQQMLTAYELPIMKNQQ